MKRKNKVRSNRIVRHLRLRKKVQGTSARPRLCVFRSLSHLEAQFVDDFDQRTLLGLSTRSKDYRSKVKTDTGGNVTAAKEFGKFVAEQAKEKGIRQVVFDRGGYQYHGRVKAFAEAARENGLSF